MLLDRLRQNRLGWTFAGSDRIVFGPETVMILDAPSPNRSL